MNMNTMKSAVRWNKHVMYWGPHPHKPCTRLGLWGQVVGFDRTPDCDYLLIKCPDSQVRRINEGAISHICN